MGEELDWAAGVDHLRLADAFSVALCREIAAWLAPGRKLRCWMRAVASVV